MAEITTIVQILASSLAILQFLSPLKDFVNPSPSLNQTPFFCMLLSTLLWSSYGVLRMNSTIIMPNLIGLACASYYLYCCYRMIDMENDSERNRFFTKGSIPVLLWLSSMAFSLMWENGEDYLGMICVAATFALFASPLSELNRVLKERDPDSISSAITLAQTLNCAAWSLYGMLIGDIYVVVPNVAGLVLALIALGVKIRLQKNGVMAFFVEFAGSDAKSMLPQ